MFVFTRFKQKKTFAFQGGVTSEIDMKLKGLSSETAYNRNCENRTFTCIVSLISF